MVAGSPIIEGAAGVPAEAEDAWALSRSARRDLEALDAGQGRPWPDRARVAAGYAAARGRISSTELAGLVGAQSSNVGAVLRGLEEAGLLEASRPNRRGKGFFYHCAGSRSGTHLGSTE